MDVFFLKYRVVPTKQWTVPKPLESVALVHSPVKPVAENKKRKARPMDISHIKYPTTT